MCFRKATSTSDKHHLPGYTGHGLPHQPWNFYISQWLAFCFSNNAIGLQNSEMRFGQLSLVVADILINWLLSLPSQICSVFCISLNCHLVLIDGITLVLLTMIGEHHSLPASIALLPDKMVIRHHALLSRYSLCFHIMICRHSPLPSYIASFMHTMVGQCKTCLDYILFVLHTTLSQQRALFIPIISNLHTLVTRCWTCLLVRILHISICPTSVVANKHSF